MNNHVHLHATPAESVAVSRLMQTFGRNYALLFDARHRRTGTLWEGHTHELWFTPAADGSLQRSEPSKSTLDPDSLDPDSLLPSAGSLGAASPPGAGVTAFESVHEDRIGCDLCESGEPHPCDELLDERARRGRAAVRGRSGEPEPLDREVFTHRCLLAGAAEDLGERAAAGEGVAGAEEFELEGGTR